MQTSCRSGGKHTTGQAGAAEATRMVALERRLVRAQAAEQRVHNELMKAYEKVEAVERDAAQTRDLQTQMQVLTDMAGVYMHFTLGLM